MCCRCCCKIYSSYFYIFYGSAVNKYRYLYTYEIYLYVCILYIYTYIYVYLAANFHLSFCKHINDNQSQRLMQLSWGTITFETDLECADFNSSCLRFPTSKRHQLRFCAHYFHFATKVSMLLEAVLFCFQFHKRDSSAIFY